MRRWHILDPLGGEDLLRLMCGVTEFTYTTSLPRTIEDMVSFRTSNGLKVTITTGQQVLSKELNWYKLSILNISTNASASPEVSIHRNGVTEGEIGLAKRYFEYLTGLALEF